MLGTYSIIGNFTLFIILLIKVNGPSPKRHFSFLNPLAPEIWLCMLGSYFLVSVTMWIVARFSPLEWKEPELCDECLLEMYTDSRTSEEHYCDGACDGPSEIASFSCSQKDVHDNDCILHPFLGYGESGDRLEVLENEFTVGNSFWFGIGTLMQQGSHLNPKVQYFIGL